MNKYKLNFNSKDKYINIPIQIKTDNLGRDNLIDTYEDYVTEEVINPIEDFEVTRYAHKDWISQGVVNTSIEYKFNFFDRSVSIENADTNSWVSDYVFTENPNYTGSCFNEAEIYYNANSFKRSFFKLDLYDTIDSETQQIYLTIIIPTQQGKERLSSTTPFTGGSGQVNGPTVPDVVPGGPASARGTSVVSESAKVYEKVLRETILKNQGVKPNKRKLKPQSLAYKEQLKYEIDELNRKAQESQQDVKGVKPNIDRPKNTNLSFGVTPTPSQSLRTEQILNKYPTPTPTISNSLVVDRLMIPGDSYEVTLENCNSQAITKYIDVNLWNGFFDWPNYGYSKYFDGTCYEITQADTTTIVPDPPLNDFIDSSAGFFNYNCGCITPTPSTSLTPSPTPLPEYTLQLRTPAPIGVAQACTYLSPNLTLTYNGPFGVGTQFNGIPPAGTNVYGKIFSSNEPGFQYNNYVLTMSPQFAGGTAVAQLSDCNIAGPTPTPSPSVSYVPPDNEGDVNPNPEGVGTGATPTLTVAPPNTDIKLPDFVLDYIGDKEGYFIYWLKNPTYINIDTLYMGAKFFNAKTGQFVRMTNRPQSQMSQKFNFDKSKMFYRKVYLDTNNYEYEIRDAETDVRIGQGNPINWYEYINPS